MITSETVFQAVFVAVMLCWLVFAMTFLLRRRPQQAQEKKRDNTSRYGLAMEGAAFACVWGVRRPPFASAFDLGLPVDVAIGVLAIALAVASSMLVSAAVKTLGKQWAVGARIVDNHALVTNGPYRFTRNPIYAGMMGLMIATGLAIGRWWVLPPACLLFWMGTKLRVRSEEKLLREEFGKEFEEYARRVPFLIPLFPTRG